MVDRWLTIALAAGCFGGEALAARAENQRRSPPTDLESGLIERLDAAIQDRRCEDVRELLSQVSDYERQGWFDETPLWWVLPYEAYLSAAAGDALTASVLFEAADIAMAIELGEARCEDISTGPGGAEDVAEAHMCGEIFLGYYQDPTDEVRQLVEHFRSNLPDMRTQTGALCEGA